MTKTKHKTPPKPYDGFPLFAHAKGYWAKKIDKRQETFGRWAWPDKIAYEKSWRAALSKYHDFSAARARGDALRTRPDEIVVETLIDAYLTRQESRVGAEIKSRSFYECRKAVTHFRDAIGRQVRISELEHAPDTILDYCKKMEELYGWHAYNKRMAILSGMFIWAEHPIYGVLPRPFRLRVLFKKRDDIHRKREKRLREAERGKQRWTPDELQALFAHAANPLRAMLKLAYFAAFGNSDCADVPQTAIELSPAESLGLPKGWAVLDWFRPKTEIERAAVLPPDVADDIIASLEMRPEPNNETYKNLLFITRSRGAAGGMPFVRDAVHKDEAGSIVKVVNIDGVGQEFRKLRNRLSRCPVHGWFANKGHAGTGRGHRSDRKKEPRANRRPEPLKKCPTCKVEMEPMRRLGFYTFRHTACTYAAGVVGASVLDMFEGRVIPGSRKHYVEEAEIHDLRLIAERLMKKLSPTPQPASTHNDEASTAAPMAAASS